MNHKRRGSRAVSKEKKQGDVTDKAEIPTVSQEVQRIQMNIKMFAPKQKKDISKHYTLMETLGQGSYGCVKRIRHKDLNEDRALKIIKKK